MQRLQYFLAALEAQEYRRTAWIISAFSLIMENADAWKKDPYPFRIVQTPVGFFFVDPADSTKLVQIEDAIPGRPLFTMKERVQVKPGAVPNLGEDIETSYGNLLFNCIVLVYAFGNKMPYMEGKVTARQIEELILPRLKDNDDPIQHAWKGIGRDPQWLYVDEYLRFCDGMFSLMALTQLCVTACTPKSITAPPGVKELRTKLLNENKGRLHDPAVIAKIDSQLVAYLKEWFKDDPSLSFLIYDKSFTNVRRKLYLMGGAEVGMDDKATVELVERSLSEGWDPKDIPVMNTASRSGSHSRGAQTELGGEAVKWLFRASSNLTIAATDCGSTMGVRLKTGLKDHNKLIGFTALVRGEQVKITPENVDKYLGKIVTLRSSMYCRLDNTDLCSTCLGDRLSGNPTGLSAAIADYGSTFMLILMKAMHSTELKLAKMNYREALL